MELTATELQGLEFPNYKQLRKRAAKRKPLLQFKSFVGSVKDHHNFGSFAVDLSFCTFTCDLQVDLKSKSLKLSQMCFKRGIKEDNLFHVYAPDNDGKWKVYWQYHGTYLYLYHRFFQKRYCSLATG